jgi:hypothetical protein
VGVVLTLPLSADFSDVLHGSRIGVELGRMAAYYVEEMGAAPEPVKCIRSCIRGCRGASLAFNYPHRFVILTKRTAGITCLISSTGASKFDIAGISIVALARNLLTSLYLSRFGILTSGC